MYTWFIALLAAFVTLCLVECGKRLGWRSEDEGLDVETATVAAAAAQKAASEDETATVARLWMDCTQRMRMEDGGWTTFYVEASDNAELLKTKG